MSESPLRRFFKLPRNKITELSDSVGGGGGNAVFYY